MDILGTRNQESPIFRNYVEQTLRKHVAKIKKEQDPAYSRFRSSSFRGRNFTADQRQLVYTQSALYRFVDMKKLRKPRTGQQYRRKKIYDYHNRVLMGHYNGIMKDLIYGASEAVIADMRKNMPDFVI